jgi:hypothetical protein
MICWSSVIGHRQRKIKKKNSNCQFICLASERLKRDVVVPSGLPGCFLIEEISFHNRCSIIYGSGEKNGLIRNPYRFRAKLLLLQNLRVSFTKPKNVFYETYSITEPFWRFRGFMRYS